TLCTTASDLSRELDKADAKLRAGAHFLVTDVIYDVEEATRVLDALRSRGVALPVLATLAPFQDIRTLQRLSHEVPEISIPLSVLAHAAQRHRRNRDHPEQIAELAVRMVEKLRHLVAGVVVHVPSGMDEPAVQLVRALVRLRSDP
ncbi:MAG: methylenetetrahydrofolate reductase, partial [Actinomycetes bacterium]